MNRSFFSITHSPKLEGTVTVSGSKNASMVMLISSILAKGTSVFRNVPAIADIIEICKLLTNVGAQVVHDPTHSTVIINTDHITSAALSYEQMKTTRASILLLGPLLARFGYAQLGFPGGDNIGARPIDLHISALQKLGITTNLYPTYIEAQTNMIHGGRIVLAYPSVGATENCLMAATLATGTTIIMNAAIEPEVIDLISLLQKMGAHIAIEAPATIKISGVKQLVPVEYTIMPDRLEAGALLIAAGMTQGDITVTNIKPDLLDVPLLKLEEMVFALSYTHGKPGVRIKATNKPKAISIKTGPYPQFPTDLQPPIMALCTIAKGTSIIDETVFENRMKHSSELNRMGASINVSHNNKAVINGTDKLIGTSVAGEDIRAVCALVLAGLAAEGNTQVYGIDHWKRGFEKLDQSLQSVGASITLVEQI